MTENNEKTIIEEAVEEAVTERSRSISTQHEEKLEELEKLGKAERREQIKQEITARLKDESIWIRFLHLIAFGFAFFLSTTILLGATILQFLLRLFTGEPNVELQKFGRSLGKYFGQLVSFALFNSEDAPFPFSEWPKD